MLINRLSRSTLFNIQRTILTIHDEKTHYDSDSDHDGDSILRLQIAYDENGVAPRPVQISSLARDIRRLLEPRLPNTFPVFRFLAASELAHEAP